MRAYSVVLGQLTGITTTASTVHTVATGTVSVMRDLDLFSSGAGAAASIRAGVGDHIICRFLATANPQSFDWRGRQVFVFGDSIRFVIESGTWWVRASGYRLSA